MRTSTQVQQLVREAFLLGFMLSRDGYNAEVTCDHCCEGLTPPRPIDEARYVEMMLDSPPFMDAMSAALDRLGVKQKVLCLVDERKRDPIAKHTIKTCVRGHKNECTDGDGKCIQCGTIIVDPPNCYGDSQCTA